MKKFISFLILACAFLIAQAQSPKYEVRAVWLTTIGGIDWPHSYQSDAQKRELNQILDQLQKAGINTVLHPTTPCNSVSTSATSAAWSAMLGW